jgi:hypothetical protein
MNVRKLSIALMIALTYELLSKLGHAIVPSITNIPAFSAIPSILILLIIILFLYFFHLEERANRVIGRVLVLLLSFFVIRLLLKTLVVSNSLPFTVIRLSGFCAGLAISILLFVLMFLYQKTIPLQVKHLQQATIFTTAMFGIGILKSLGALIDYSRFLITGNTTDYPPLFMHLMTLLFMLTHLSMIYFLFRYHQFKSR